MRISTNQLYARGTLNILEQQQKLLKLQNQFSSGLRVSTASDDPIASSQIEIINQRLNSTEIYQKNNSDITSTLNLQEGILDSIMTSIQSLQSLQVQAGNEALSEADRKSIAQDVQSQLSQLQSYANSKNLTGEYLFSGSKNNVAAISRTYDNSLNTYVYSYDGDDKQLFQAVSDSLQVALNNTGNQLFMDIPAGNGSFSINQTANPNNGAVIASGGAVSDPTSFTPGASYTITMSATTNQVFIANDDGSAPPITGSPFTYTSGTTYSFEGMSITLSGAIADGQTFSLRTGQNDSVFSTVQRMVDNLNAPYATPTDRAEIQTENNQLLMQLSNAFDNISKYRSDLGARLNQLESTSTSQENLNLITKEALKLLREIDPAQVASDFTIQTTNLEAALKSFVSIQNLSVFNYI